MRSGTCGDRPRCGTEPPARSAPIPGGPPLSAPPGWPGPTMSAFAAAPLRNRCAGRGDSCGPSRNSAPGRPRRDSVDAPTEHQERAMATDLIDLAGHEQVAFCSDPDTGLRAIIALHDTSLGPGLGGTRFHPYSSTDQALADVLRLSRAMTSKNAVAGLDHGGGKAVIIGDPQPRQDPRAAARLRPLRRVARRPLRHRLRRRHLRGRHGRRRRVHPVGHRPLARARRRRRLLGAHRLRRLPGHAGRRPARVGRADPRRAPGRASRASARWAGGSPTTSSRTAPRWSSPTSTPMPCAALLRVHPRVQRGRRPRRRWCARRSTCSAPTPSVGALDDETVEALRARVVCGGANNQLVSEGEGGTADRLLARGITYAPDFLVNAGGVIQVSDELHGFDMHRARERTATIFEHTLAGAARRRCGRGEPRRGRRPARRAAHRRGRATALAARRPGRRGPAAVRSRADRTGTRRRVTPLSGTASPDAAPLMYRWRHDTHTIPGTAPRRGMTLNTGPSDERCRPGRRTRGSRHGARPSQGQADEGRSRAEVLQPGHRSLRA